MTLHAVTGGDSTIWWYYATPTTRRGTAHLLRVPRMTVEPERVVAPQWMGTLTGLAYVERWRLTPVVVPARLTDVLAVNTDPYFTRICNRRQAASWWTLDSDHRYNGTGICDACLNYRLDHPELVGMPDRRPNAHTAARAVQSVNGISCYTTSGRTPAETIRNWRDSAQTILYVPR